MEQEQERTRLLEKVCKDFKKVHQVMEDTCEQMSQHIEDICWMKVEVSYMKGEASVELHGVITLQDMIQKDCDAIN